MQLTWEFVAKSLVWVAVLPYKIVWDPAVQVCLACTFYTCCRVHEMKLVMGNHLASGPKPTPYLDLQAHTNQCQGLYGKPKQPVNDQAAFQVSSDKK